MKDVVIMYQDIRWRKAHRQARKIKGASDKRGEIRCLLKLIKEALKHA